MSTMSVMYLFRLNNWSGWVFTNSATSLKSLMSNSGSSITLTTSVIPITVYSLDCVPMVSFRLTGERTLSELDHDMRVVDRNQFTIFGFGSVEV